MTRRNGTLGWIVAGLGLLLCCCLIPYLISSAYSVASTLLQVPAATRWLWGDWLSTVVDPSGASYRLMVEAPICCGGAIGLLLAVFGVVWVVNGSNGSAVGEQEATEEACAPALLAEAEIPIEPAAEPDAEDIERATW